MIGTVTKKKANAFWVNANGETTVCTAQKKLKENGIFVGDHVVFDETQSQILALQKRKNKLLRPPVANIDCLIILVTSAPQADFLLLDKLLLFCAKENIQPVICHSKIDLGGEIAEYLKTAYAPNFVVVEISAKNNVGLENLKRIIQGKVCALGGQSGVGKSELINALTNGKNAEVGELSSKIQRGKNTTRHAELFEIGNNTFIADTAGFSSLDERFLKIPHQDLARFYPEFLKLLPLCKFSTCSHLHEPECAVKSALETGEIDSGRYNRYKLIYETIKQNRF